jgi:hypothetical protein
MIDRSYMLVVLAYGWVFFVLTIMTVVLASGYQLSDARVGLFFACGLLALPLIYVRLKLRPSSESSGNHSWVVVGFSTLVHVFCYCIIFVSFYVVGLTWGNLVP